MCPPMRILYQELLSCLLPLPSPTPVTQDSHVPVTKTERDIMQPMSSEKARATYLENQMMDMSSVQLPSKIPSMEEESHVFTDLMRRINMFCKEQKEKRRQEQESHKQVLNALNQSKGKQPKPDKEEREVVYSQIAQDMEKTTDVVRRSMIRASIISAEE